MSILKRLTNFLTSFSPAKNQILLQNEENCKNAGEGPGDKGQGAGDKAEGRREKENKEHKEHMEQKERNGRARGEKGIP